MGFISKSKIHIYLPSLVLKQSAQCLQTHPPLIMISQFIPTQFIYALVTLLLMT